jgi:hypothetical protein
LHRFEVTEDRQHAYNSTQVIDKRATQTRFAEFIEQTAGDIDVFITRVSQLPAASQNRLLQEKILLMNEKLSNIFEEIQHVKKFHNKLGDFCQKLRENIIHGKVDYATGCV